MYPSTSESIWQRVKPNKYQKKIHRKELKTEFTQDPTFYVIKSRGSANFDLEDFPKLKSNNNDEVIDTIIRGGYVTSQHSKITAPKVKENFLEIPPTRNYKISENPYTMKKYNVADEFKINKSAEKIVTTKRKNHSQNIKLKESKKKTDVVVDDSLKQSPQNSKKKKRADPVLIHFKEVLARHKARRKTKLHNAFKNKTHTAELLPGNYLDSANPKRSRGKFREVKKRKLSNFKKIIIKERIIKQKLRENALETDLKGEKVNLISAIDFKTQIKQYLDELDKRLQEKAEQKKSKLSELKEYDKNGLRETKGLVKKSEKNVEFVKAPQHEINGEIKYSSKYREYCDNIITPELNSAVVEFMHEIVKLQDRLFSRDPIKAKSKKKHVSGMREVKKYLNLKKVKLILIAPNLEKLEMEGSVLDCIQEIKSTADAQNVPYAFALDRYKLGRCAKKVSPISAFAILSYEGAETQYESVIEKLTEAKKKFMELTKPKNVSDEKEDVNAPVLASLISAFREGLKMSSETIPEPS